MHSHGQRGKWFPWRAMDKHKIEIGPFCRHRRPYWVVCRNLTKNAMPMDTPTFDETGLYCLFVRYGHVHGPEVLIKIRVWIECGGHDKVIDIGIAPSSISTTRYCFVCVCVYCESKSEKLHCAVQWYSNSTPFVILSSMSSACNKRKLQIVSFMESDATKTDWIWF